MDFKDKRVAITGGTGTLGNALAKKLLSLGALVSVMSRNEKVQHEMKTKFPQVKYYLGDVADKDAVRNFVLGADIVIHAAAVKHIPVAEKQPRMTCLSNVVGSMNVVDVCKEFNIEQCICISTDKAAAPFNTYGMTKYLMEQLFSEASKISSSRPEFSTKFKIVRYGNVFGSNGSVIPFWMNEKKEGRKLKVTDPDMTRFFFSVDDAVDLILKVIDQGDPGVVYLKKMKAARLGDVAEVIDGEDYEVIGNRGKEKEHEALFSQDEAKRVSMQMIDGEELFVIRDTEPDMEIAQYTSDEVAKFTKDEIKQMIKDLGYEL